MDLEEQSFFLGVKNFRKCNFVTAISYFEKSKNNPEYKEKSLYYLCLCYIKLGNYLLARQMLENSQYFKGKDIIYGLIENIEYNFEKSREYYAKCISDPNDAQKALLGLAKLYVQMGEYDVAKKIYETLKLIPEMKIQAIYGLSVIYIMMQEYEKSEAILKEIKKEKLTNKLQLHYDIIDLTIKYYLGTLEINKRAKDLNPVFALINPSDERVLKHVKKHCNQSLKDSYGCFFSDIDLKSMISMAKQRIESMNPNHFEISDMYRFTLDFPIGYKGENITHDLCVATVIGQKNIITMYPVLLSDDFNKEGMATSDALKRKREKI